MRADNVTGNNIKISLAEKTIYSVVGRYMNGINVTAYHLVGDDGSSGKVSKDTLIVLASRDRVKNIRVQTSQGVPLIRGKGININELKVYDERSQSYRGGKPRVTPRVNKPDNVFKQAAIVARIKENKVTVGYVIVDQGGNKRSVNKNTIIQMATNKMLSNARVQRNGDDVLIRGVGEDLTKLPVINLETVASKQREKELSKQTANDTRAVRVSKPNGTPSVRVSIDDIKKFGDGGIVLSRMESKPVPNEKRYIGIKEVMNKKARLYVQADAGNGIVEYISRVVKLGENTGTVMRIMNRANTGIVFDIKETTAPVDSINEKVLLAIMCCGIEKYTGTNKFNVMAVQAVDASSQRVYNRK